MDAFHKRSVVFGDCDGFWQKRITLLSIYAVVLLVNIHSTHGDSNSTLAMDKLNPMVNRDSLTKNNTDAAVTVNFHFEKDKPSEEEVIEIYNKTRVEIVKELNRGNRTTTAASTVTTTITDSHTTIPDSHTTIIDSHTTITDSHTTITDSHTTITDRPTTITDKHTTITDEPTTVDLPSTVTTTKPVVSNNETALPYIPPERRKKRSVDVEDFKFAAGDPAARQKRDTTNEDDLYTEEDLPFVNITEWFKDGVLSVPIFIKNDKGPGSEPGNWNVVGDRLFDAATAVKDELAAWANVSNVTIIRGLPNEQLPQPMVSANTNFSLGIILGLLAGLGLIIIVLMFLFFICSRRRNYWEKIPIATEDGQKVLEPSKICPLKVSNGRGPASIPCRQSPVFEEDNWGWVVPIEDSLAPVINDDCGWLIPMDQWNNTV